MKSELVAANTARLARIEAGETTVVGVNRFTEAEPSPLTAGDGGILVVDPAVEAEQVDAPEGLARRPRRRRRRGGASPPSRPRRGRARTSCRRRSPPRRPASPPASGAPRCARSSASTAPRPASARPPPPRPATSPRSAPRSRRSSARLGRRLKFLVGKPGLDGHSNGAEQIAVRARDSGMEVRLRGHPPDPRPDRQRRAGGERPRRRPLDPLGLAPAARHRGDGADAGGRPRRRAGRRRRHHPRRRRRDAARGRRRPRLHARRTSS